MIQFGETNSDLKYILDQNNQKISEQLSSKELETNQTMSSISSSIVAASTKSLGDYNYKTSVYSKWISDPSGYWSYTQAPPNSQITNLTNYYAIILDVFCNAYSSSSSGGVLNRVWTNTEGVSNYLKSTESGTPTVGAFNIYSWFGSSDPNIHINTAGPTDGSAVTVPTAISFAAHFIAYGDIVTELLNYYFSSSVSVGDVSAITTVENSRTYMKGKYVKSSDKQANVVTQPTNLVDNAKKEGGLTFNFDYLSYGSNKSLTSGAQVVYYASVYPYYSGYFWSDKVSHSWTE